MLDSASRSVVKLSEKIEEFVFLFYYDIMIPILTNIRFQNQDYRRGQTTGRVCETCRGATGIDGGCP